MSSKVRLYFVLWIIWHYGKNVGTSFLTIRQWRRTIDMIYEPGTINFSKHVADVFMELPELLESKLKEPTVMYQGAFTLHNMDHLPLEQGL
jgi:hypothetical protein